MSFNTGAPRHTGSSKRPSTVTEPDDRTTACTPGGSLPAPYAEAAPPKRTVTSQKHFCPLQTKALRGGLGCFRMRATTAPPVDEVFETNSTEAGHRRFSEFRR